MTRKILIAGGYGTVGSHVGKHLRAIGYDGELVLAGRDPAKGAVLATEIGASTCELDYADRRSAQAAVEGCGLVLAVIKDPEDHLLDAAIAGGAAMVAITHSADTVAAPLFRHRDAETPIDYVTAGHWQAGMAMHAARHLAADFRTVETIAIAAQFDPADAAGPMAREDTGEYMSRALIRRNGRFQWVDAKENARTIAAEAGDFGAIPMGVLDTLSLAAVTSASDIRVDIGFGPSRGTGAGARPSHDIHFELSGIGRDGRPQSSKSMISAAGGQAHFTAIGIAAIAEAMLARGSGQRGEWLLPEMLVSPQRAMELAEMLAGASFIDCAAPLTAAA